MPIKRQGTRLLFLVLGVFVFTGLLFGQAIEKGAISGRVLDPSGAVVPGASVKITHTGTGTERTITTGGDGRFLADVLPPGEYTIEVSMSGFATTVTRGVRLSVGQNLVLDVNLQLAAVGETIEVTAAGGPVEKSETLAKTVVDNTYVENLPILGRDFRGFVNLSSTADLTPGLRSPIRLGGQFGEYTGFIIDGVDNRNSFFGEWFGSLETRNFTVPQDAIQEFQVRDTGFSAEFGHALGGLINVATKSGTNEWHGTAHWFFMSDDTVANASTDVATSIPPGVNTRHQFGGTVGGPLKREKVFVFFALDAQQQRGPLTTQFTDSVRTECLASPVDCAVVSLYGGGVLTDYEGIASQRQDLLAPLVKFDWHITSNHTATTRLNYTRNETNNFTGGRSQIFVVGGVESNFENFVNDGWAASQSLTSVIGTRSVNEVRFAYSREVRPRVNNGTGPETCIFPFSDCFGRRFFLPIDSTHERYQVIDNFSHTVGKHDLKFGFDLNSNGNGQTFIGFAGGMYNFLGLDLGLGFGCYSDDPTNSCGGRSPLFFLQLVGINGFDAIESGTLSTFWQHELSFYAQDMWRIHPHVTLNLGLRWDGVWNPNPSFPIIGSAVPIGRPRFTSDGVELSLGPPPQGIPDDFNNWAPRVGVAWDVGGKGRTIVRGGTGLYYAVLPSIFMAEILAGQGFRGGTISIGTFGCPTDLTIPRLCYPDILPSEATPALQALLPPPLIRYADPDFESARVWNIQGGIEHEIVANLSVSGTYTFSRGDDLRIGSFWNSRLDRNIGCTFPLSAGCQITSDRIVIPSSEFDQFGRAIDPATGIPNGYFICFAVPVAGCRLPIDTAVSIADNMSSFGRSRYHAVLVQLKKAYSHRHQFGLNYTWSRNRDNVSNDRDTDAYFTPSDPFNFIALDYGRSQLDIEHQFRGYAYFLLPWDIEFSTGVTARSGRAFPAYVAPCGGEAGPPARVELVGPISRSDDCSGLAFNHIRPVVGNRLLPRYPFRNASFFNWDFRVARAFPLGTERVNLRVSFEVFNLFDRDNTFSFPTNGSNAVLDSSGQVPAIKDTPSLFGAGGPIAAQFGLKIIF